MEPRQPSDPEAIGKYRITGRLGSGGMGAVYLGLSPGGRPAAVKVIGDQFRHQPEALERFRREVQTLRTVHNAYTAALIDFEVNNPPFWLATEYIPGLTLLETIERNGPAPAETCLGLFAALAEGLADIHAHGVYHRDLKPANIILSSTGPRLIDFGIARGPEQAGLTQVGMVVGTPGYTAPEVLTHNNVGPAADVFALGATIAYTATGRPPYGEGTSTSIAFRVLNGQIDLDGVDQFLAGLILACVAVDPAQRPSPSTIVEECQRRAAASGQELNTGAALFPMAGPGPTGTAVFPAPSSPGPEGSRRYTASASVPAARPESRRMPGLMPPSPTSVGQAAYAPVPGPTSAPPATQGKRLGAPMIALIGLAAAAVLLLGVILVMQFTGDDKGDPTTASGSTTTAPAGAGPSASSPTASASPSASQTTDAGVKAQGSLVSGNNGLCMQAPSSGSNGDLVVAAGCDGSQNQHWTFNADGTISSAGKCLDLGSDGGDEINYRVQIWDCNASSAQEFQQESDGSLRNPAYQACIGVGGGHSDDDDGDDGDNQPKLRQGDCTGDPELVWRFS
jgi:serine/threonine protein kinase